VSRFQYHKKNAPDVALCYFLLKLNPILLVKIGFFLLNAAFSMAILDLIS